MHDSIFSSLDLRQNMAGLGNGVYNEHGDQGERFASREENDPTRTSRKPFRPDNPYNAESMNAKHNPLVYEGVGFNNPQVLERPGTSIASNDRGPGYSAEGFGFNPPTGIVRHDIDNDKR